MAFINRLLGGGPSVPVSVSLAVKDAASKQSNIRQHCQHQHQHLLSSLLSLQFRRHKGSGRGSGFYRHPGSPPPPFPHPSRHSSSSSSDKPGGRFPIDTGSGSEQRSFAELHFFSAGRTYESYPLSPGKGGSGFARPQQQAAVQQTSQILKPQQILKYLDKHVIGQEHAKKVLAVSVYNHFCRLRAVKEARQAATRQAHLDHLTQAHLASATAKLVVPPGSISINDLPGVIPEKSNVLLIGPSGCGKTLLAKTVSRLLRVPFAMGDATGLTEAGYVGEDVDSILFRLLEAADFNLELAQSGIVFLDEVDKIAKAAPGPKGAPSSGGGGRDVGGEGVQHALLKMLEGTVVQVADRRRTAGRDYIQMDTSNLLFILSGAFVGLEGIVARRLQEAAANCGKIGFAAVVGGGGDAEGVSTGAILSSSSVSTSADAKANASADGNPDANTNTNTHTNTNTNRHPNNTTTATPSPDSWINNLLIEDVITYGLIPEFIGRVPVLAVLEELDQDALVRTLTEPKNALIKQYQHLFAMHNICLSFTPEALIEIGAMAVKAKTGARGLRGILEKLLLPMMYEMPGREDVREVCIDAEYVRGERQEPVIILK